MEGLELPEIDFDAPEAVETPEIDAPEAVGTPEPEDLENPESAEENPDPAEENPEEPADGRKMPDDVRKAIKAFRDSSPENAKAARALIDSYGREQAYKAEFPDVQAARAAKTTLTTIDSMGGLAGIQTAIGDLDAVDQMLQSGDVAAVDKIMEVAGEGFAKIAPAVLDKFQAAHPEAYAAAIRPHLVNAISGSGLQGAFQGVLEALDLAATPGASPEFKQKFEQRANQGLASIKQWLESISKPSAPAAPTAGPDPKMAEREQKLTERESQIFDTQISTAATAPITTAMNKAVASYVKGFNQEQRADFVQSVYNEVAKRVAGDKDYQMQKASARKTKDPEQVAKLMSTKFSTVVGDAAKAVRAQKSKLYGKSTPVVAQPGQPSTAQGAPAGAGTLEKPILVKQAPNRTDVDFDKTTEDMLIRGVRVLKSGKVVKIVQ